MAATVEKDTVLQLQAKLQAKLEEIEAWQDSDPELVETDVRACGIMESIWLLKFRIAEELKKKYDPSANVDMLDAWKACDEAIKTASQQGSEWSKRKSAALSQRKLDLLPRIIDRLNNRDKISAAFSDFAKSVGGD